MVCFRGIVAGVGFVVVALASGGPAAAATDGYATTSLAVRSGPGSGYPLMATIGAGSPITIEQCLSDRSWCAVDWHGRRGWVAGRSVNASYGDDRRPVLNIEVNAYRRQPPLNLGAHLPSLNPRTVIPVGLPSQEPSPHACGIGQYPANGSCW
jgi:hypothetical protein